MPTRTNVAPFISGEKAAFVRRQLVSTLLGGPRLTPAMTARAHLAQCVLWLVPPAIVAAVAVGLPSQPKQYRLLVAGGAGTLFCVLLESARWLVCRRAVRDEVVAPRTAWFADYDDVDFSRLLSPAVCRALVPPKRSVRHLVLSLAMSFALLGTAAAVLVPADVDEDLRGSGGGRPAKVAPGATTSGSAAVLCALCLLAVAAAHYGLLGTPPVEATAHRYRDPMGLLGLLVDFSRPILLLALLLPILLGPRRHVEGVALRCAAAVLPPLWAVGIVPQLDTLLLWALEQVQVHLLGGSPIARDLRLLVGTMASAAAPVATFFGGTYTDGIDSQAAEDLPAVVAAVVAMPLAAALAALPPGIPLPRRDGFLQLAARLGVAQLQVAASLAVGLGVLVALGGEALQASLLSGRGRHMDRAWAVRLGFEQFALVVSFVAVYGVSARHLRVDVGWTGCLPNRRKYRAARDRLLGGAGLNGGPGAGPEGGCASASAASAASRIARIYAALEVLVRVALLAHIAAYGATTAFVHSGRGGQQVAWNLLEAATLCRAFRVAAATPPRAAVDAWLAGMLDLALALGGVQASSGFLAWSLGVRLCVVSVARSRLALVLAYARYAAHLARATASIPKLRHPVTGTVLFADFMFLPLVVSVLVFSAVLESPLVALFTLPVFWVGYPRPRHGHPELSPDGAPMVKGVEGLFYRILVPSLLRGLAPRWRCGALDARPGAMLFCRSHERLACVVRVLGAGYGWVNVEIRGLEMQEPTSCHHVEAGKIDDAFSEAFTGPSMRPPRSHNQAGGGPGATQEQRVPLPPPGAGGTTREAEATLPQPLGIFALTPVCEVTALCYEQTQLSLRGIIDNPETLHQVHRVFLRTLVWVLAQETQRLGDVPDSWLTCPLKAADAQMVVDLLRALPWPQSVASRLGLEASSEASTEGQEAVGGWVSEGPLRAPGAVPDLESFIVPLPPGTPPTKPRQALAVPRARGASPDGGGSSVSTVTGAPHGSASAASSFSSSYTSAAPPPRDWPPPASPVPQAWSEASEDLDTLMDMVLDMAPSKVSAPPPRAPPGPGPGGGVRYPAPAPIGVPYPEEPTGPNPMLRLPKQLAPLEAPKRLWVDPVVRPPGGFQELGDLAKLVVQAYVALDVATACGQVPEALGSAHVFRIFAGQLAQGVQAPELLWLEGQPDLRDLALRAFRYAVKVTVDCAVMAEDASALDYSDLDAALEELERFWHLGDEAAPAWQAAMESRVPNLMAFRRKKKEIQIVRLCLREDGVRVGELRSEVVQSIWASESLELRYCTNDDDERYSIQAHPTLFRNMIVQSAEYPIYVSAPTTVWI